MEETGVINVISSIDLYTATDNENSILTIEGVTNKPSITSLNVGDV